jgi:hypothetical protein
MMLSVLCYICDSSRNKKAFAVNKRRNHVPGALKHGAYSNITLLPGEDPAAFEKLHDDLFAEFAPQGAAEEDVVRTMSHVLWRKRNLIIYKMAENVRSRYWQIIGKSRPSLNHGLMTFGSHADARSPEEIRAATEAAEREASQELGEALVFVETGKDITIERLFEELSVVDRLDSFF